VAQILSTIATKGSASKKYIVHLDKALIVCYLMFYSLLQRRITTGTAKIVGGLSPHGRYMETKSGVSDGKH
jgi:hypothetical protein